MGLRVLLFAALAAVVFFAVRGWLRRSRSPLDTPRPSPLIDMVACEHCGLHVPAPEAVRHEGHSFCTAEHLAAWQRTRG